MKQFKWSRDLLQILQRRILLERVGELFRTHGADFVVLEAAMELGVEMLSVATDEL